MLVPIVPSSCAAAATKLGTSKKLIIIEDNKNMAALKFFICSFSNVSYIVKNSKIEESFASEIFNGLSQEAYVSLGFNRFVFLFSIPAQPQGDSAGQATTAVYLP